MSEPTVTLFKGGKNEKQVPLSQVEVPDLWHIAQAEMDLNCREKVLRCWHLANDLLRELRERAKPETTVPLGFTPGSPKNPFRKETWNLTAQMKLQRNDPQLAARLKDAAKEGA